MLSDRGPLKSDLEALVRMHDEILRGTMEEPGLLTRMTMLERDVERLVSSANRLLWTVGLAVFGWVVNIVFTAITKYLHHVPAISP